MGQPDGEDGEFVEAVERHQQHQHRHHIGRSQDRRDRGRADDRIAARPCQLLAGDDSRALQDHQQDREEEGGAEAEDEPHAEIEIIADPGQRFLGDATDIALEAQEEVERPRHRHEIGKAGAGPEEERGHQQERQERLLFLRVHAGRDEPPQLRREHGEADHQRREQADLHLDEKRLENVGVDELALARLEQRLDEHREDVPGECEADEEGQDERHQAPQQPPAKLDQMFEQRLLGLVDVLHGSGRFSGGRSSGFSGSSPSGSIGSEDGCSGSG